MGKYIDLKCDFAFKYCMQDEVIMKSFLNAILEGETEKIIHVKYENVEQPKANKGQRGVCFDLLCTTERGETILIEMQNASQRFFKTRAAFYTSNLMNKQITRGFKWEEMEQDIAPIIGIFIMGSSDETFQRPVTRVSLYDRDDLTEFWDRIHYFFISLPHFQFDKENITTKAIWMELFKNLGNMNHIDPSVYERADEGLLKLIKKAETSALSPEEYALYEASMKMLEDEMDMERHGFRRGFEQGIAEGMEKGRVEGRAEGRVEGRAEGRLEALRQTVLTMKQKNVPIELISEFTQLTKEEIEAIDN